MKNNIKVSIVVPVYNAEDFLDKCLEPLVNQTLKEIEVICVDDGSKDGSGKIIDEYAKKYPKIIKAYHKKNGGEWSARTYGLKKATGEYVGFMDNDDVPEVTWAEKLYNAAIENNADIAFCGYDRIKEGKLISTELTQYGYRNVEVDYNDDFIVYANPSLWNKIYRREIVKDTEFYAFRGCNDTLFFMRSYIDGARKLTFIPDVLYHYTVRSGSQINNMTLDDINNLKKYFLVLKDYTIKKGVYDELKESLAASVFLHLAISWMHMVSYNKEVNMKQTTEDVIKYMDNNFELWRKSKFYKLGHCLKKGFKFFGIWGVHLLYKMHLQMIYIRLYKFMLDKLHIYVKW